VGCGLTELLTAIGRNHHRGFLALSADGAISRALYRRCDQSRSADPECLTAMVKPGLPGTAQKIALRRAV
jgi:hypothetical protein